MTDTGEDKRQGFGRPLKFKSVADLQRQIDKYFRTCDPHWVQQIVWEDLRDDDDLTPRQIRAYKPKPGEVVFGRQVKRRKMVLSTQVPYSIVDLALALHTTRETLLDYEKGVHDGKDSEGKNVIVDENAPKGLDFSDTVKRAKQKVLAYQDRNLLSGKQATGTIFSMINNFNWKNKSEVEGNQSVTHRFTDLDDEELDAELTRAKDTLPGTTPGA